MGSINDARRMLAKNFESNSIVYAPLSFATMAGQGYISI
jgi:hypothetical protein